MTHSIRGGAILALAVSLALAGCQSSRLGALETRPSPGPAPLTAAPSGTVTSGQLPPPAQPNVVASAPTTDASGFPTAPAPTTPTVATPDVNGSATPSIQPVSTGAPIAKEKIAGVWNVNTGGSTCRVATSLTKFGDAYRAASLGCGGDVASLGSWNVSGTQLVLNDRGGAKVATLFADGSGGYSGQTNGGRAISLTR